MISRIYITVIVTMLCITSCATSMTPMEVNSTLPTLTKSKYISQAQADEKVKNGACKYLVKNRTYVAPMGLSTKEDLKYGAKGIDEWVKLDGGNAYVLKNYKWVTVDQNGSTQLNIDFDTMICE
jgi:hypothetical protein